MAQEAVIRVEGVTKQLPLGKVMIDALRGVDMTVYKGEMVGLVGPSGSGKSTLLGILGGLDAPTAGRVEIAGIDTTRLGEGRMTEVRNENIGFIFQFFNLIPTLTALENVMVPMELQGQKGAAKKAMELLARVGLADRYDHYPAQLSGGEQQRVALARAFANSPKILFADEPTGNLDPETHDVVEKLLFDLNKEAGTTLVLVTHDLELAAKTQQILKLKGGKVAD